jgi:hypothetical protein
LSNQRSTVVKPDNKTVVKPDNNKRHKRHITKDNIVPKLSDKESLSAFLLSLPEYQTLPIPVKEPVLTFADRVRQSNQSKKLAPSRVKGIMQSFKQIIDKYGVDNMLAGINAVFSKEKKTSFTYSGKNPTGYVRAVAKPMYQKQMQQEAEKKAQAEKALLKSATDHNGLLAEINQFIK